jgi:hypothetical protein
VRKIAILVVHSQFRGGESAVTMDQAGHLCRSGATQPSTHESLGTQAEAEPALELPWARLTSPAGSLTGYARTGYFKLPLLSW